MKRSGPIKRRGRIKRSGRSKYPPMAPFWRAVTDDGENWCVFADAPDAGECWGPLDAHHFIKKSRLWDIVEKALRAAAVLDPRNGVTCCREHHGRVENANDPLEAPRPPLLEEFCADYGVPIP